MGKLKHVFLLSAAIIFFAGCLKEKTPIPGATGKTGISGAPGGNLTGVLNVQFILNGNTMTGVSPNCYVATWYEAYNHTYTYMISAYANKANSTDYHKLPWVGVFFPGDELYCTVGNDSVKIHYYTTNFSGWPADSTSIYAEAIVVPPQP